MAILGYPQHPSRHAIQFFLLTTSIINCTQFKKKLFTDDVINIDSAHERHFWTTLKTSIRRKRVKLYVLIDYF